MADVICLNSDSDFESSPPKNTRTVNNRNRRKTRRGLQGKAGQSSSSSKENTCHQIISSLSSPHVDLVSSPSANVPSQSSRDGSVDSSSISAFVSSDHVNKDVICGNKPLPDCHDKSSKSKDGSTQSRKTARRGLARKINCSEPTVVTPTEAPTESMMHSKASVYSDEHVNPAFQNIYSIGNQLTDTPHTVKEDKKVKAQQQEANYEPSSGDESTDTVHEGGLDPNFVRSPTPPPEVKKDKPQRISRRAQKALRTLNSVKARFGGAQRRAQTPIAVQVDSPVIKADMIIKVRFLSKVYRLRHNLNQPFHQLLTKVSKEIGKREDHLGLFLNDNSLGLTSTPKDVHLSVADIIECYNMTETGGNFQKGDSMNVVIQCSNSKKKTTMTAYKRLPLQDLMDRYASEFDFDISMFTFCFDGEYVSPTDTLLKLDVEEGDVFDVVPKTDGAEFLTYDHKTQVITLI